MILSLKIRQITRIKKVFIILISYDYFVKYYFILLSYIFTIFSFLASIASCNKDRWDNRISNLKLMNTKNEKTKKKKDK
jgi:hypothetical protein